MVDALFDSVNAASRMAPGARPVLAALQRRPDPDRKTLLVISACRDALIVAACMARFRLGERRRRTVNADRTQTESKISWPANVAGRRQSCTATQTGRRQNQKVDWLS